MEKFRDIVYERPFLNTVRKQAAAWLNEFKKAGSFEEADGLFLNIQKKLEEVMTQNTIAYIRNTMDMSNPFYDDEISFFNRLMPKMMLPIKKTGEALLKSPFRSQFEEKYGSHMLKDTEEQQKLIKLSIVFPSIRENELCTDYSRTAASCSTEFMGETCNFYGLLRHMQSPDRAERKAAFEAWAGLYEGIAPELETQYGRLVELRCIIANRLGFKSYIDYVYPSRGRYDYGPDKVAEFREAVRKYVTPVCERMYREQADRLGIDKLQWYDEDLVFPDGNARPIGTPEELTEKARQMYEEMSPETGEFFDFMTRYELYDFVTRENKHLGGYCTFLQDLKAPFIFSNFNGTSADINVLTHEAGHAFQAYYASRRMPLHSMTGSTSEVNEIHSMAMELFAYPYMERFFGADTDKYRYAHFIDAFRSIPYLVSVDEFQHRVFAEPGSGPSDWRRFWKETEQKYMPWRSYDGNEFLESGGFWMQKQHVFLYQFYYVDYALAQIDAFALYRKQLAGEDAWGSYLKLCGMGGKYGYFETLERAGIPMPLDEDTVKETAEFAEKQAEVLKAKVPGLREKIV